MAGKLRKATPLKGQGTKRLGDEKMINRTDKKTLVSRNFTGFQNPQVAEDRLDAGEGIGFAVL